MRMQTILIEIPHVCAFPKIVTEKIKDMDGQRMEGATRVTRASGSVTETPIAVKGSVVPKARTVGGGGRAENTRDQFQEESARTRITKAIGDSTAGT